MRALLIFIFLCSFSYAGVVDQLSRNKKVVVVFGKNAPKEEKAIAQKLYKALELDNTGDLYDHIIDDEYALKHKYFYSKFHLIIVGTAKNNLLCAPIADIQTADLSEVQSNLPPLNQINPLKSGYFNAKYGLFDKAASTGFIRRMLNPFTMESFNLSNGKAQTGPVTATYITGTDIEGMKRAYFTFLDHSLLEGVVPAEDTMTGKTSRFKLGKGTTSFPFELNEKFSLVEEDLALKFMGWIQGSLSDYSGIYKMAGITPKQVSHLKFSTKAPSLMTYDDHSNSILAIEFQDATESFKALNGMDKSLKLSLKLTEDPKLKVYRCMQIDARWLIIRKGKWIIIESLPMGWKEVLAKNADKLFK